MVLSLSFQNGIISQWKPFNEENQEANLLSEIESDFTNCIPINYEGRDLYSKKLKQDIEFGYSIEEWEDSVRIDQFFPNIRTGEENIW